MLNRVFGFLLQKDMANSHPDAKKLLELWLEIIDADALFLEKISKAETRTGIYFDPQMFTKPEDIASLAKNSNVADLGRYFKFLLELAPLSPRLQTMMTLKPEDKLLLVKEFRELISKYRTQAEN